MLETRLATTEAEKDAVFRSRYAIYVEEMGRYQATADHANKMLSDPEDDWSWIVYTTDGTDVVASTRMTWGGDGFSDRQIEQYGLAPFLAELPAEMMLVGERTMISPSWRGADLFTVLTEGLDGLAEGHGVRVVFGACEPHLLSFYARFQRTYAPRNITSAEAGYLIPLISFIPDDVDALLGLGGGPGLPECIRAVIDGRSAVTSPSLDDPAAYEEDVIDAIRRLPSSVFDGFADDEIRCCIARSNVIDCAAGERILKKGGAARNVFVVLAGALEVSNEGHVVGTVRPGEMFGETAYLLHGSRTFDVDARASTRILSLSERTLRNLTDGSPVVAAKLLTNVSKVLCRRLSKVG